MSDLPQLPVSDQGAAVIDLAAHAEEAAAYAEAVTDAVEELNWMSGTLIATALGLDELQLKVAVSVGTVVVDPQQVLAHSTNWRVRRLLDLSAALLAGAESLAPRDNSE